MNKLTSIFCALSLFGSVSYAQQFSGVTLFDDNVSFFNGAEQLTTGVFEARWGTFSEGNFVPYFGSAAVPENDGYIGDPFGFFEAFVTLTAIDNSVVGLNTPLYLAFTLIPDQGAYAGSANEVVLTDPSWIVPSFTQVGNPKDFFFTASTTAVKGNFQFNSGSEIISIVGSVIPEPSAAATLGGLIALGAVAARRRRAA